MKFLEKDSISIPRLPNSFVYFLLDDEEVVYVGKTKNGIVRPLSHFDKKFTDIKIIPVPEEKLSHEEEYYISKYSPKYNKVMKYYVSALNARDFVRLTCGNEKYTVRNLKNDAVKFGINLTTLQNGSCYIHPDDLSKLCMMVSGMTGEQK